MSKGQKVEIIAGKFAGKTAFFDKVSGRGPEFCFVQFTSGLLSGAQIKTSELGAA